MESEKKVVPICSKCIFKFDGYHGFYCGHPDSPITEFMEGIKECNRINGAGQCKLYRAIPPKQKEEVKTSVGSITVDLTLNTEPFKKKMAELLAGL